MIKSINFIKYQKITKKKNNVDKFLKKLLVTLKQIAYHIFKNLFLKCIFNLINYIT